MVKDWRPSGSTQRRLCGASKGVLGYCQALFRKESPPEAHTEKVMELLYGAGLPNWRSHELVAAHQSGLPLGEFVSRAVGPLALEGGQVPVFITPYVLGEHRTEIQEILDVVVDVDGTILVRLLVKDTAGMSAAAHLIRTIATKQKEGEQPSWLPLVQVPPMEDMFSTLTDAVGEHCEHVALAVNPWSSRVPSELVPQIAVVQVPVGPSCGVGTDGEIAMGPVAITGAPSEAKYHLPSYLEQYRPLNPTYIILGPAQGEWDDGENVNRVRKVVAHLESAGVV